MVPVQWFRSAIAAAQVSILAVLATGIPGHYHEDPFGSVDQVVVVPDHHHHVSELYEQDHRVLSSTPALGAAPVRSVEPESAAFVPVPVASELNLHPRERAPPPHRSPRPPPHLS